uniref:Uncharacterized protein n=1 Tax=Lymantria dispar multicapsid nuclear polyhedrosis virus TaxID=10449 RepID=A0A7S8FA26_NPVLD|nr:hypothetical protein [Lymantria dispar multiple nucleopolyhedrovirus]QPD02126.1 hypothetical protein [Lymantria dispar multiple nucleopolyhedrovirus]
MLVQLALQRPVAGGVGAAFAVSNQKIKIRVNKARIANLAVQIAAPRIRPPVRRLVNETSLVEQQRAQHGVSRDQNEMLSLFPVGDEPHAARRHQHARIERDGARSKVFPYDSEERRVQPAALGVVGVVDGARRGRTVAREQRSRQVLHRSTRPIGFRAHHRLAPTPISSLYSVGDRLNDHSDRQTCSRSNVRSTAGRRTISTPCRRRCTTRWPPGCRCATTSIWCKPPAARPPAARCCSTSPTNGHCRAVYTPRPKCLSNALTSTLIQQCADTKNSTY